MEQTTNTILFRSGLAVLGLTLIAAVIVAVALGVYGARLRARLDEEYGKKRRREP
jgi:hypothetical protein